MVYYGGLFFLWRLFHPASCRILRYHKVLEDMSKDDVNISVSKFVFEKQMDYLIRNCEPVTLRALVERLMDGGIKSRKQSVAVTFDDGYKNNIVSGYPILKKFNIPATIFVTVDYIGTKKIFEWDGGVGRDGDEELIVMSWEDMRSADPQLVQFESHGLTHRVLTGLDRREVEAELRKSKEALESKGYPVKYFAYPKGYFNPAIKEAARVAGYEAAFACDADFGYSSGEFDPFAIKRKAIHEKLTADPFGRFSKAIFALEIGGFFDSFRKKA